MGEDSDLICLGHWYFANSGAGMACSRSFGKNFYLILLGGIGLEIRTAHSQWGEYWLHFIGFRIELPKNTIITSVKDHPFLPVQCPSPVPSMPKMALLENAKNKFTLWKVYGVPVIWIISSVEYPWLISTQFSFDIPIGCIWNSVSVYLEYWTNTAVTYDSLLYM